MFYSSSIFILDSSGVYYILDNIILKGTQISKIHCGKYVEKLFPTIIFYLYRNQFDFYKVNQLHQNRLHPMGK